MRPGIAAIPWAFLAMAAMGLSECLAGPPAGGTASPFVSLLDTRGEAGDPLPADALAGRPGWAAVAEDKLDHAFAGDAVFLNDRLAVVLRKKAGAAEVYSRSAGGFKLRAALVPVDPSGRAAAEISSVGIVQNSSGAVTLEAAFKADGNAIDAVACRFRLAAGAAHVEVRPARGAARLRLRDGGRYCVLPDFFADDGVLDPSAIDGDRVGLPAENMLLSLVDDGSAIVACLWSSSRQFAEILLAGEGPNRKIAGYEIDLAKDKALWIAVLEAPGIWHGRTLTQKDSGGDVALDWRPPFAAKWRGSLASADGARRSWDFAQAAQTQPADLGGGACACWFASGRPMVRLDQATAAAPQRPRTLVVYPIDRSQATPLSAYCVVDLMRNTLGMGPCQYVLDAEGLQAQESATPDQVTRWAQKQFEKKAARRDADAIVQQLAAMTAQVRRTDARIREYGDFARQARDLLAGQAQGAPASRRILAVIEDMEKAAPASRLPQNVEEWAGRVAALAGSDDDLASAEALCRGIRAAGAAQDYALARRRGALRSIFQVCRTMRPEDLPERQAVDKVRQLAEDMLWKK